MAKKTTGTSKAPAAAKKKSDEPAAKASVAHSMIDTTQAASSAAAMLAARARTQQGSGTKPESADFKKLKASLTSPQVSMNSPVGGASNFAKPSHSGFAKQVGHNQTFGANVAKTGVPRRTSGG